MVLNHIPQCTCTIIETDAALESHRFGDSDLDMLDMLGVPQRFEQDIGKAQRQQILHRLFAEIMVDTENALFGEGGGDGIVDRARRRKIGAERLFEANAHLVSSQSRRRKAGNGLLEQRRRCGEEDR